MKYDTCSLKSLTATLLLSACMTVSVALDASASGPSDGFLNQLTGGYYPGYPEALYEPPPCDTMIHLAPGQTLGTGSYTVTSNAIQVTQVSDRSVYVMIGQFGFGPNSNMTQVYARMMASALQAGHDSSYGCTPGTNFPNPLP